LAGEPPKVLFKYAPHSTESAAQGDVIIGEGRIPNDLPAHWAAVEPQVEFDAILMANEWSPAVRSSQPLPPPKPWWLDSAALTGAVSEIKKSNIQLQPMKVAVIDSGADLTHPALQGAFAVNENEIDGNGIDDDGNGLIDDRVGYDFILEKSSPADEFGHGTHVAGLIRNRWSDEGLFGGAMNARLKIFRALDARGKSNSIDLSRAISAAIQESVDLMNCSWGGGPETQVLRDAFAAAKRADILVFASAGNDSLNSDQNPQVPKKFSGVFSIGASTQSQTRARFSNWGAESVFLFAPGSDILSSLPDGRFGEKSGTSMASPIAASGASLVAGVLRKKNPEWSRAQLNSVTTDILCKSSEKNRLAVPNSKCGSLNVLRAIQISIGAEP
jgi:subtilisin family serine protease